MHAQSRGAGHWCICRACPGVLSICCDTSGAGVVVLVPGRISSSIMLSLSFAANTSWTPSHSSPESSEAMIAQSGCLCSSPRSRCCLCSSPRRRCRRSRCRLCSRCRRGQRGLPRLCRGSAHGETDLTTGELDRRGWQRVYVCSNVLCVSLCFVTWMDAHDDSNPGAF